MKIEYESNLSNAIWEDVYSFNLLDKNMLKDAMRCIVCVYKKD